MGSSVAAIMATCHCGATFPALTIDDAHQALAAHHTNGCTLA